MLAEFTGHLWQSTFFTLAAGLLTLAFRRNRAQVRYWIWLSASLKFFLPFALLMSLGSHLQWAPEAHQIATNIVEQMTPAISDTIEQFNQPLSSESSPAPAAVHWVAIIGSVWLCGFLAIALMRFRSWLRIRAAVRASTSTDIAATVEVRTAPGLLEPGIVGFLRPILLLPEGIAHRLTSPELEAVLAHELCHIRRRDNLFAAIHMIVEATFWFHPLVWWIGARLVEERERACDEEVIRHGNDPGIYADAILNVCKLYTESPLACVSGVTGASIKQRIKTIMTNPVGKNLSGTKKTLLAGAGTAALLVPVAIGLVMGLGSAPTIRAQSSTARPQISAAPVQTAQVQSTPTRAPAPPPVAPPPVAGAPAFDVISIKPCSSGDGGAPPVPGGRGGPGGRFFRSSPGRLSVTCMSVWDLMINAYVQYQERPVHSTLGDPQLIRGGPAWVYSDFYTIEAETADPLANSPTVGPTPAVRIMMGPMLQTLLEERFRLKIRRETEEIPMYALTVAKSGLKMRPMEEGGCTPVDPTKGPVKRPAPGEKPLCTLGTGMNGPNLTLDVGGMDLSRIASTLSTKLDRPVIDRTGITELFSFHLEFGPEDGIRPPGPRDLPPRTTGPSDIPSAPSIFTVIEQQLGLKLAQDKGPRGYIVIDHIERPSEN